MKLNKLDKIPEGLLTIMPHQAHQLLGGPTLLHLEGERRETLFISTLLHGNETSGFLAMQKILKKYQGRTLPKSLIFFIGNTLAAQENKRLVAGQLDYNRIWSVHGGDSEEHRLAAEILKYVREYDLFASIDIHNNNGENPYYSCINVLDNYFYNLAHMFSKKLVYFTEPHSVQSMAFSKLCPSVTIEAGKPGEGIDELVEFIDETLKLSKLSHKLTFQDFLVYHTTGTIKIAPDAIVDFTGDENSKADISFVNDLESLNFKHLQKDYFLGYYTNAKSLKVLNNNFDDVTDKYFHLSAGKIHLNHPIVPAMFHKNVDVMKADCLGYIMEDYALKDTHHF